MTQINDAMLASLETQLSKTGQLNDLELEWLHSLGSASNQINDAWVEFLTGSGFPGARNDAEYEWLGSLGTTGSIDDRRMQFWRDQGGIVGPGVARAVIPDDARATVVVTFNGVPAGAFNVGVTFTVDGGGAETFTGAVAGPGANDVTYTASSAFVEGEIVRWLYTPGNITVGGEALPLQDKLAINQIVDISVVSSEVTSDGLKILVTFNKPPVNNTGFTFTADAVGNVLTYSTTNGNTQTYSFATPVEYQDVCLLSYTPGDITDAGGYPLAGFTDAAVTNNSEVGPPILLSPISPDDIVLAEGATVNPYDFSQHFRVVPADGAPIYTEVNLVNSLTIDGTTGIISGTVTDPDGAYPGVVITATNSFGSADSNTFTLTIVDVLQKPTFVGPIPDFTATVGTPFSEDVSSYFSSGDPVNVYALVGAPSWMSIDGNGVITGTPTATATHSNIKVRASNGAGSTDSNTFDAVVIDLAILLQLPQPDATGLIDLDSWEDARSTPVNVPDFEGVITEIPQYYPVMVGARIVDLGGGDIAYYTTDGAGDPISPAPYWGHYPQSTNYADGDDDLAGGAETIDLTAAGTGDYTLSVYGTAAVTVAAGTATGSGFGQATEGTDVTFNLSGAGTITLTLDSGTLDVYQLAAMKQVEKLSFSTPFIVTSGAPVVRFDTLMRYPFSAAVFNQTEGMLIFDWVPEYNVSGSGNYGIVSIKDGYYSIAFHSSTGPRTSDDTAATVAIPLTTNGTDKYRIAVRWNTNDNAHGISLRNLTTSGSWVSWKDHVYSGQFDFDTFISLFYSNISNNQLHSMKIYNMDKGVAWIEDNF